MKINNKSNCTKETKSIQHIAQNVVLPLKKVTKTEHLIRFRQLLINKNEENYKLPKLHIVVLQFCSKSGETHGFPCKAPSFKEHRNTPKRPRSTPRRAWQSRGWASPRDLSRPGGARAGRNRSSGQVLPCVRRQNLPFSHRGFSPRGAIFLFK